MRLAVLRRGDKRKTRLNHRLLRQSDVFAVEDYLGSSPTFVLKQPLRVKKDNIVAITVPTWLPALAADLSVGNWWRSSRAEGQLRERRRSSRRPRSRRSCARSSVTAAPTSGARLLYTATYIPDPTSDRRKRKK